jgi:hypothetical protein
MAAKHPAAPSEAVKQIHFLAAALKAPRITEAAARLADQARDAGWTHEDYLAAVLEREVSARNASGAAQRIRWAGFPARKTLDDFDWDHQLAVRQQVAALASGAFLTEARNVVLLGPPGTGKTHLATGLGVRACQAGHRVLFATAAQWVDRLAAAHHAGTLQTELARLGRCLSLKTCLPATPGCRRVVDVVPRPRATRPRPGAGSLSQLRELPCAGDRVAGYGHGRTSKCKSTASSWARTSASRRVR